MNILKTQETWDKCARLIAPSIMPDRLASSVDLAVFNEIELRLYMEANREARVDCLERALDISYEHAEELNLEWESEVCEAWRTQYGPD